MDESTGNNFIPSDQEGMGHHWGLKELLLALILLAVLFAFGMWLFGIQETTRIDDDTSRREAQEGEIVSTFPEGLIIEPLDSITIVDSSALSYEESDMLQSTVVYTTSRNMSEVADAYSASLQSKGWFVTKAPDLTATDRIAMYLRRPAEDVNIVLVAQDDGMVRVTIGYLQRPESPEPSPEQIAE